MVAKKKLVTQLLRFASPNTVLSDFDGIGKGLLI
jgi:hypothetical protein